MKTFMKLHNYEPKASITNLYDAVATEMGYADTSELKYDCRKINVAKNIQDGFFEYYKEFMALENPSLSESDARVSTTMLLLIAGPKVDNELADNEVEVFDGFICTNANEN